MALDHSKPRRVWTVAEAKAKLSEIFRLAEEEGPQRIGTRKSFVVVPDLLWRTQPPARKPLGQWLVDHVPRGANLEIHVGRKSWRPMPFIDEKTK